MTKVLINLPSPHLEALARPSTLEVLQAKECALTSHSFVFVLDSHLSLLKRLGVRHPKVKT